VGAGFDLSRRNRTILLVPFDAKQLSGCGSRSMTSVSVPNGSRRPRALVTAVIGIQLSISAASSHDWYPIECCRENDCAEVEHATYDGAPDISNKLPILAVSGPLTLVSPLTAFTFGGIGRDSQADLSSG
jgi:hypothetical protein